MKWRARIHVVRFGAGVIFLVLMGVVTKGNLSQDVFDMSKILLYLLGFFMIFTGIDVYLEDE